MRVNSSKEINEIVEFGLDKIDPNRTIEIKLKDFMFIYKIFEEFNRFFHQSQHFQTINDVELYVGSKEFGAYSLIHQMYYTVLYRYLPDNIIKSIEEGYTFESPIEPYYFNNKSNADFEDGTENVLDKKSFTEFAREILQDCKSNSYNWTNNNLYDFIDGIASYAEDIDGYYQNMKSLKSPNIPTWRIFAQILKGATQYE